MSLSWPVKGPVSQHFGSNPNSIQPNGHTGVDFAIPVGTPLYAPDSGNIEFEGWASTLSASNPWWIAPAYAGIVVLINHNDGFISLHGHLSSTVVNNGQFVEKGQLIGYSGSTGLSTGPHLHYEILGWPLQPYNGFYGRINPSSVVNGYAEDEINVFPGGNVTPGPSAPNQRLAKENNVNQRSEPNTNAPIVRIIAANTLEVFDGYVHGEDFAGTNVWYKDVHGYAWAGAFTNSSTDGLNNLTPAPALGANQRKVGEANVNQRVNPNTSSAVVRVISANTVETFTAFVRGENVVVGDFSSNIWYKDAQGYAWAGGFHSQDTAGLPDETPAEVPVLQANQRVAGPIGAIQRDKPERSGAPVRTVAGGTTETFTGFVRGESVTIDGLTTDIWYKDDAGYVWAGAFTSQDTAGLADLTPVVPTDPIKFFEMRTTVPQGVRIRSLPSLSGVVKATLPPSVDVKISGYVEGDVVADSNLWYVLEAGYSHSSGWTSDSTDGLEKLVIVENPVIVDPGAYGFIPDFAFVEYRPANTNNMQDGNFPANPAKIVLHQFDAKDKFPSIDGVIKHFQTARSNPSSAHFVVSGDRIVQMVSLRDRAFHAGTIGNDYIGIEVDPQEDAKTVASVKKLIAALNKLYGKVFTYTKHRDVPGNSTLCGADIHLENYVVEEEPVIPPVIVVPPVDDDEDEVIIPPVVKPEDPEVPARSEEEIIREFLKFADNYLIEKWRESQQ